MRGFFSFPHPVDDAAARTVALGVVAMSVLAILTNTPWLLVPLTYGFLARVAAGPKISPLGRFAVHVAAPRIHRSAHLADWSRPVPGPPKRFAQGIGAVISSTATVLWLTGHWDVGQVVLLPLVLAASLEGFVGYCLGCTIFGWLIRAGLVPEAICEECGDLTKRWARLGPKAGL